MSAAIRFAAVLFGASFVCVLLGGSVTTMASSQTTPSAVSCTPQRPAVVTGKTMQVRVWISAASAEQRYTWTAKVGRITGQDSASWDLTGVKPGIYVASVKVTGGERPVMCSLRVIVLNEGIDRAALTRVTGRQVLGPGATETPGYGLYSYLLFGNPPDDASKERYLKAIQAYLDLIPDLTALEKYAKAAGLNATYLPINVESPESVSADWLLGHYDYARAAVLLRVVPGPHADGPYIVSSATPLSGIESLGRDCLLQDLSTVPSNLMSDWIKLFINQASQPDFWQSKSTTMVALRLRTAVGILAMGLPEVQKSLTSWISWSRSVSGT
jgi:hypothetical protein